MRSIDENHEDAFRAGSDAIVALITETHARLKAPTRWIAAVRGLAVGFLANRDGDVIVTLWNRKEKERRWGDG